MHIPSGCGSRPPTPELGHQDADEGSGGTAEAPRGMAHEPPAHLSASLVCCHCCGPGVHFPFHFSLSKTVPGGSPACRSPFLAFGASPVAPAPSTGGGWPYPLLHRSHLSVQVSSNHQ